MRLNPMLRIAAVIFVKLFLEHCFVLPPRDLCDHLLVGGRGGSTPEEARTAVDDAIQRAALLGCRRWQ